jgi:hypothetical protein
LGTTLSSFPSFVIALVLLLVFMLLCNFIFTLLVVWHCFLFVFSFVAYGVVHVIVHSCGVAQVLSIVLFRCSSYAIHGFVQNELLHCFKSYKFAKLGPTIWINNKIITYVTWMKVLI